MCSPASTSRPKLRYRPGWGANAKKVPRRSKKPSYSKGSDVSQIETDPDYLRLLFSSFHIHTLDPKSNRAMIVEPTSRTRWENYREAHWEWIGQLRLETPKTIRKQNRWGETQTYLYPGRTTPVIRKGGKPTTGIRAVYELVNGPVPLNQKLVQIWKSPFEMDVNPFRYRIGNAPLAGIEALVAAEAQMQELDFDAPADPISLSREILAHSKDPDFGEWVAQVLGAEEPETVAEAFRLSGIPRPLP